MMTILIFSCKPSL